METQTSRFNGKLWFWWVAAAMVAALIQSLLPFKAVFSPQTDLGESQLLWMALFYMFSQGLIITLIRAVLQSFIVTRIYPSLTHSNWILASLLGYVLSTFWSIPMMLSGGLIPGTFLNSFLTTFILTAFSACLTGFLMSIPQWLTLRTKTAASFFWPVFYILASLFGLIVGSTFARALSTSHDSASMTRVLLLNSLETAFFYGAISGAAFFFMPPRESEELPLVAEA